METSLPDEQSMIQFGTSLLTSGSKFLLYGELGAGKTTVTKGIACGLGIDPSQVVSPTYTYIHIYEEKLLHIDMRRIETEQQIHTLGLLDLIDQYPYIVIEWPKREENYADDSRQKISITQTETGRIIVQKDFF